MSGRGSTLVAANVLADQQVTISAKAIDLQAVADESRTHTLAKSQSVTLGSALAGMIGDKITAIGDAVERSRHTDNDRLKGALVLQAGYEAYKLGPVQGTPLSAPAGSENAPVPARPRPALASRSRSKNSKAKVISNR